MSFLPGNNLCLFYFLKLKRFFSDSERIIYLTSTVIKLRYHIKVDNNYYNLNCRPNSSNPYLYMYRLISCSDRLYGKNEIDAGNNSWQRNWVHGVIAASRWACRCGITGRVVLRRHQLPTTSSSSSQPGGCIHASLGAESRVCNWMCVT